MKQSALLETAARVLRDTQHACPYNNFSNLFVLNGYAPDPRFGGDCLYQAKVFGERLRSAAANPIVRFHNYEGQGTAGHIVPFVGEDEERAACEITALASEPVVLRQAQGVANAKDVATLPLPPVGDRSLRFFWIPQAETLHIKMMMGNYAGMLHHRIATDSPIHIPDAAHPIDHFMCLQPRKPLKLQVLDSNLSKTVVCMNPVSGAMSIRRVGAEEVHSDMRRFDAELASIATALGATRAQLMEFFHEGLALEREMQGLA